MDPVVRRFVLVALVLPVVVMVVAVAIQLALLPLLPDPAAIHWGADGQPDGFAPAWVTTVVVVFFGLGVTLLIGLSALRGLRRGGRGPSYRALGALCLGLTTYLAVLTTWTLVTQAGLADAADAPSVWLPLAASLLVGVVAGVIAWRLQPEQAYRPVASAAPEAIVLGPADAPVWMRTATMGRVGVLVALVVVALAAAAVGAWLTAPTSAALLLSGLALLIGLVAAAMMSFRVRVDDAGLAIRSSLGWPRFAVALDDIASVAVVEVEPIGDFGGYGLRWAGGRTGVVLRRGPALSVTRKAGRVLVVTVDDAAQGAALLQALVDRSRTGSA
jgi:hypothetical protein